MENEVIRIIEDCKGDGYGRDVADGLLSLEVCMKVKIAGVGDDVSERLQYRAKVIWEKLKADIEAEGGLDGTRRGRNYGRLKSCVDEIQYIQVPVGL